jgi:hypothetical protein
LLRPVRFTVPTSPMATRVVSLPYSSIIRGRFRKKRDQSSIIPNIQHQLY